MTEDQTEAVTEIPTDIIDPSVQLAEANKENLPDDAVERQMIDEEEFEEDLERKPSNEEIKMTIPAENVLFEPKVPEMFKGDGTSIFPSYSKLVDQRHKGIIGLIKDRTKRYKEVFKKDLEEQYMMSRNALSGVRMARCFVIGVHLPKQFPDPLTSKQRARVEYILKYNIL